MTELARLETRLPMLGIDDWDEIRKAEATLEAYRKYAGQDKDLRDEALQIGEATVRLKWHKGGYFPKWRRIGVHRINLLVVA